MAEEGLIDKAIGLIPGVGKAKPRQGPRDIKTQVAQLQRNLLKLSEDVERLGKLIAGTPPSPAGKRRAASPPNKQRTASRRRPKAARSNASSS